MCVFFAALASYFGPLQCILSYTHRHINVYIHFVYETMRKHDYLCAVRECMCVCRVDVPFSTIPALLHLMCNYYDYKIVYLIAFYVYAIFVSDANR